MWVIESDMAILTDTEENDINRMLLKNLGISCNLFIRIAF